MNICLISCEVCGKEFPSKKSMTNHRRWHSEAFRELYNNTEHNWNPRRGKSINIGSNNGQWRGDDVTYGALHDYIRYNLPKVELCQCCRAVPPYDLANISGEYRRDFSDWEWLCRKCHMLKDGRLERFSKISKKSLTPQQEEEIKKEYIGKRGQKVILARKYGVCLGIITRLVGKSYVHGVN